MQVTVRIFGAIIKLVLLLEAGLPDDTGAQEIVMDVWVEIMEKKGFWKKAAGLLFLLALAFAASFFAGMSVGRQRAEKEAVNRQEQGTLEAAKTPEGPQQGGTDIPEPAGKPAETPERSPAGGLNLTATVSPAPIEIGTEEPSEMITPAEAGVPAETGDSPKLTAEQGTTPEPAKAPEPAGSPTAAKESTVTKKPAAASVPAASGEDGYYGALHVEGTYLADAKGEPVQLRGISTHGLGWFPEYVNEKAIRQFKEEWGCNVIRLAMYTAEYNGYCTSDAAQKKNLKKIVDTGVTAATSHNMYAIIDWHILQDSNPHTNKEEAKKFFAEAAEKYKDNPNVIYEICNEPNGDVSWSEIKSYALEIIPVIRKYAPEAVIIVGTPTWSQDVDLAAADPITEYGNIMYALHFYADTHREGLREKCKTAVKRGLPVFVSEFGICDASGNGNLNREQADLWISMLDSYGISYVTWNLSNKAESSSLIKSSCNKKNGFTEDDLSEGGKWFVDMLQKAGAGIGSALSGTTEEEGDTASGEDNRGGTASGEDSGGQQATDYIVYGEGILEPGEGLRVTVSNGWNSGSSVGLQLNLTVEALTGGGETDWERRITIKDGVKAEVAQNWNSTVELKGNTLLVRPADYNKTIAPGASVGDIGIILNVTE